MEAFTVSHFCLLSPEQGRNLPSIPLAFDFVRPLEDLPDGLAMFFGARNFTL
jgi:hypothetical protein